MTQTRIVSNYPEGERVLDSFLALLGEHFRHSKKPLMVSLDEAKKPISWRKNRELEAHLRDIARWRVGDMYVPERIFDNVVDDFKRTDIWPKESTPEPDTFTGELLYRPISRAKLTQIQAQGIVNWLEAYMHEHNIPSHAPVDNWQIPEGEKDERVTE